MCDYARLYVRLELASDYAHITPIASFVCFYVCCLSLHPLTSGLPPGHKFPFILCTCLLISIFMLSFSHHNFPQFSQSLLPFLREKRKVCSLGGELES